MAPLWFSQPFKAIFIALFLLKSLLSLLLLSLLYIPRSLRPLPEWSFRICLVRAVARVIFQLFTDIHYQRPRQLEPGKAKGRFAVMEPPNDNLFTGVLAPVAMKPEPVPGIWFPAPVKRDAVVPRNRRVVLQFVGGAFVVALDPNSTGKDIASLMGRHLKATNTFIAQYRLATPKTRFPAAVQDALTVYSHVLRLGVSPEDIILSGDSAGGNLILALLRYIEMSQTELPCPGGAILWSPWVQVTADAGKEYEESPEARKDFLIGDFLDWGANSYMPDGSLLKEAEPFISPMHHPFGTDTPLFIHTGGQEVFSSSIKSFADEMSAVKGNRIKLYETDLAPHDLLIVHGPTGLTAELETATEAAYDFFQQTG